MGSGEGWGRVMGRVNCIEGFDDDVVRVRAEVRVGVFDLGVGGLNAIVLAHLDEVVDFEGEFVERDYLDGGCVVGQVEAEKRAPGVEVVASLVDALADDLPGCGAARVEEVEDGGFHRGRGWDEVGVGVVQAGVGEVFICQESRDILRFAKRLSIGVFLTT